MVSRLPDAVVKTPTVPALRMSFGTYKKSGPLLENALLQAIGESRDRLFLIDTACKYQNHAEVAALVRQHPHVRVGSKMNRAGRVAEDLAETLALFGTSLYRVLLHRPMPLEDWKVLERAKKQGLVKSIGVSNYSSDRLQELLSVCEVPPDVVQNELHPCIATPMVKVCHAKGIRFEAHSVMTANEHLTPWAERLQVSPAEVAIAYCLGQGVDVCFSTVNLEHLRQNTSPKLQTLLTEDDLAALSLLAFSHPIRIYRAQGSLASQADVLYGQLESDIAAFLQGRPFSDLCRSVPKTYRGSAGAISKQVAERCFPENSQPSCWQKFDSLLHRMRKALESRDDEIRSARRALFGAKVCALPREAVAFPEPLPVDIPPAESFKPFLEELKTYGSQMQASSQYPRRLEKGALFPDGRMDLCKQVIQPCFEELCEAAAASGAVKHFLIGNNVIFREGTDEEISSRLEALLALLRTDPPIETWYLAGNNIDAVLSARLAEGFCNATHLKALWLKMNPVKTGARFFGELAARHAGLELLDLFNTGLCDDGLQAFRDGLASGGSKSLKHLYLSINDIRDGSVIADLIRLLPNLESLFLGVNMLGDDGATVVLNALVGHPKLQRLEFGANGLTDVSLPMLLKVAESASQLKALTLGSYKSTTYFGGRHNAFSDAALLGRVARHVQYLHLDRAVEACSFDDLEQALRCDAPSTSVIAAKGLVGSKRVLQQEGDADAFARNKLLVHPQPYVNNIQSIYRNQM
eukprot:TRINITY_DN90731_c0_g1_i1.p1 TRINITY_DN90731_c0_g1~~TRINITY_DN90731_c0_g1_i1.p1  ORF type:complete len:775 (-),score=140.58 TRINITY_DN90731_c0_g1_i1:430-2682(-)